MTVEREQGSGRFDETAAERDTMGSFDEGLPLLAEIGSGDP